MIWLAKNSSSVKSASAALNSVNLALVWERCSLQLTYLLHRRFGTGLTERAYELTHCPLVKSPLERGSPAVTPNPSFEARPNGRPPGPGWRDAVHFRQPGPGVLPLAPA